MMIAKIEETIEALAAKVAASTRPDDAGKYANIIWQLSRVLLELDSCKGGAGVRRIIEKLSSIEVNIGEKIMLAKDDILATVATETQEVLTKIASDRAEIDAAQAALALAQSNLATEQANVAAAQADIAAKAVLIADLQQQIADLIAAGGGMSQADLVAIDDAIKNIFNPAP